MSGVPAVGAQSRLRWRAPWDAHGLGGGCPWEPEAEANAHPLPAFCGERRGRGAEGRAHRLPIARRARVRPSRPGAGGELMDGTRYELAP